MDVRQKAKEMQGMQRRKETEGMQEMRWMCGIWEETLLMKRIQKK